METEDIGLKIQRLRLKKGYNQNQLANKAGISPTYIRDLEAGRKNPTVQYLGYICNAMGITLQHFFTEESTLENQDTIRQLTAHQQELLNAFLKSLLK